MFHRVLLFGLLSVPSFAADLKPTIDPLVEPLTKDKPAVGLVVGVWVDGKPQVFGYGKVTTPVGELTPDGDTLFEIGSITKAFTGVLLAEAVTRGEVKLDDPANKHLPKDLAIRPKTVKPVTLLHLATHQSGLTVQPPFIGLTARNKANPYADFTRPKLVKLMEQLKPQREPDTKYEYSNLGVGLLGHAVVNAATKPDLMEAVVEDFDGLARERIAKRLGMKDTAIALSGDQKARLARGHNKKLEPTDPWDFATLEACGGLRSTVNDILKLAAANVGEGSYVPRVSRNGGTFDAGYKPTLDRSLKASHEKRASTDSVKVEVGLCWHRLNLKSCEQVVWHNGGTGGFRSMLAFTPKTKRAVVVLCAADLGADVDKLAFQVLETLQPK
jgi:serine-type D-Ala-D-Ala carboxypeptidase/endopeptidase